MPTLSRWFIKSGILWLVIALGLWMVSEIPGLQSFFSLWIPSIFHLITVGWITQLIFGVAWWMFPRYTKEKPRGHEWLGWLIFAALNLGVLLRLITEPYATSNRGNVFFTWILLLAAFLQWLAAVLFILNTWKRLQPRKKRKRKK